MSFQTPYQMLVRSSSLKIAALLCLLFVTGLLAQQIWWLLFIPVPDDPHMAAFVARYRVTSSIETGAVVTAGATLSGLLLRRQTALRILGLAGFCGFLLWHLYLGGWAIYFQAPLGDGSFSGALGGWWRLHALRAWIHLPSILFLFTVTVFLGWQSYTFRRGKQIE